MIDIDCKDDATLGQVVAAIRIDGREYARLRAIAEKFNEWTRRGLFGWSGDPDDTAATVFRGFFLSVGSIDRGDPGEVASDALDGLDMGEELSDFEAEIVRRRPFFNEMAEAIAGADRRQGDAP